MRFENTFRAKEPPLLVTFEWLNHPDGVRWWDAAAQGWVATKPAPIPVPTVAPAPYATWEVRSIEVGALPAGAAVRIWMFDANNPEPFDNFGLVTDGETRRGIGHAPRIS